MKTLNKILATAMSGLLLVGCNDLDTEPLGSTVTADQKENVYANDPAMLEASVTGITTMSSLFGNAMGTSYHDDFGYPSLMLEMDTRGYDFVSEYTGYNWFSSQVAYDDHIKNSKMTYNVWRTLYNQIYAANAVIGAVDPATEDPTLQYYLAQALAYRAFDYHGLAQLYQFTYATHKTSPCVPLVLADNSDAVAAAGGAPRATVEEVYTQILSDLNTAIDLLGKTSVTPAAGRAGKKFFSLGAAYGLRARVNLVMQNWAEAAADAQAAITKSGATPYSISDVAQPSFATADDNSWLFGVIVEEGDRVVTTGICNWPSHMGSLNYGYASVGAWRCISQKLYKSIPETDVRKGWWLDANGQSANLNAQQQSYITSAGAYPYTQVKFAPYQGVIYQSVNANDIPVMRIEEMYLILAEAQAMAGDPATGAATLQSFVSTYRDPAYTVKAGATKEDVQTAVYNQRRIELWGEGMSYFDIMRLQTGVDRRGAGFSSAYVYNIAPDDPILILLLPLGEEEANPNLGDNNPTSSAPVPVPDTL